MNGTWETEGVADVISIEGNIFHAKKPGTITARYRLDDANEIYTECKIIVRTEMELGDINEDEKIDLYDLMLCLNHVSKKIVLEGTR